MVTTEVLQCKGPNDRVEHHELGTTVVRALGELGVRVSKGDCLCIGLSISLQKAFNNVLKPSCLTSVTDAYIEHAFSLAGLIDAKNWQKMSSSLHKAAVGTYCNGDVECRFTEP